jgi:ABC-type phosphate transport system substrate-binding protein
VARSITIAWCIALVVFWLAFASPSVASYEEFKIVVHRDNPNSVIDRDFLRDIYLRRATHWSDGAAIRPIDLPTGSPSYDRFVRTVLGKSPAQLRSYWLQRIFSGTGVPPTGASSTSAAVDYVLANRGGVAYLPIDADVHGAKVIQIR